jgi:chromosomal replication initiator protein
MSSSVADNPARRPPSVTEAALRAAVAERVGRGRYDLWLGEGTGLGIEGDALRVDVPTGFFRDWIQAHFSGGLLEAAEALAGRPLRLEFLVRSEVEPPLGDVVRGPGPGPAPVEAPRALPPAAEPEPEAAPARPAVPRPPVFPRARPASRTRAESAAPAARTGRRLDDFVTGPGSRLAHAAAVEMAASRGAAFNPLVIHGGIGLGKSHLLEGVAAALRGARPGANVVHATAEAFTNAFLEAMRQGALGAFRARYRQADALVLDDVHFLAAKRATQDEFLHTFNALAQAGRPIVLAADQHPRLIPRLTDELATRFLGGMVVKLEAPDPATRRAILQAKAAARGVRLPEVVAAFIADHLRGSVRELEGALNGVLATAALTGRRLDLELARAALRDTIRHAAQAVGLRDVERAVCRLFQVEPEALRSDSRARTAAQPRMLAMYLARKHTGAAYSEIGRYFGGRNHSTVIAAEKKVAGWLSEASGRATLPGFETIADVVASLEHALGA